MSWLDIIETIKIRFRGAPVAVRADFLTEVANALRLHGDEAALMKRTYEQAESDWGVH